MKKLITIGLLAVVVVSCGGETESVLPENQGLPGAAPSPTPVNPNPGEPNQVNPDSNTPIIVVPPAGTSAPSPAPSATTNPVATQTPPPVVVTPVPTVDPIPMTTPPGYTECNSNSGSNCDTDKYAGA